ncbi:MAG: LamG domain-containing protein, partial [Saprospiraceae bacterium]
MKHLLLLFFALSTAPYLLAQDTTLLQTLQWNDNFRTKTYHFPDEPGQSWRKIHLQYNMRCRGGATCAEWAYSCNTFLTDSSRIDSSRQTFPDYVVSGFSGAAFDYSLDPTYTYYRFLQHATQFSGGTPLERTLGTGNTELAWSNIAGVHKSQLLFTAAELTAAGMVSGNIAGLKLALSQAGSELGFFRIRIKNTAKNSLDAANPDVQGFTEVYFQNTGFANAGNITFPFYQPYSWDGVSNLLVEWSYNGPSSTNAVVLATETGANKVLNNDLSDFALHFGGASYVTIPTTPLAGIATEITVALWSYGLASALPANNSVFEGANAAGARAINVHLPWSDGTVYWDCGGSSNNYDRIQKAADPTNYEGRWNHWAFTKNTATGSMKIYLNGVLWQSGTGKTIPIDLKSLVLGSSNDHSLPYFGKVDEFQVWDKELDAATLAAWMNRAITPAHPDYTHLRAYYKLDAGAGNLALDSSPAAAVATISLPNWAPTRGTDLYKNFSTASLRPNTVFLQGNLTVSDQTIPVLDSVLNAQNQVLHYGVAGTDLVGLDTNFYYPAGAMNVLDPETSSVLDHIQAPADGTIEPQLLNYYAKQPARFELVSLVTPYGNGLSLGASGKTFTFDVTDFAPILHGDKKLSVEFGGEWQEDLDLKFVFVAGVPARQVVDIQNVWPEGRGWYQD